MLSAPLHVHLLKAVEPAPIPLPELARKVGSPPPTTLRVYLRQLVEFGVVERQRRDTFPGSVDYRLTIAGQRLLEVAEAHQRWLHLAADGPIAIGSPAAKNATKALVDGWNLQIVRALAARRLALTELSRFITSVNFPTLERRLTAMRSVGLIRPCPSRNGRLVPYEATDWLRSAAAPLSSAAHWERELIPASTAAISQTDIESIFLLLVPDLDLPTDVLGSCRLSVELRNARGEIEFAGVTITVEYGRVASCVTKLDSSPDSRVNGSFLDWFRWVNGQGAQRLEFSGDQRLGYAIAEKLRSSLLKESLV